MYFLAVIPLAAKAPNKHPLGLKPLAGTIPTGSWRPHPAAREKFAVSTQNLRRGDAPCFAFFGRNGENNENNF